MTKYVPGETVVCRIWIKDKDGTLSNPTTSTKISIWDSSGSSKVASASMTQESTGVYVYYYAVSALAALGEWKVRYEATSGSYVTYQRDRFAVVREGVID